MSIIPFGKTRRELQAMRGELKDLRETNQLQALIIDDYSVAQKASTTAYVGNSYREYMKTIAEIAKKYDAEAEWGVLQTGNIVDVRAAFIIGQGVTVLPSDEVAAGAASLKGAARRKALRDTEEMKFIRDFFAYNNLDREMAQEFAKEAEIEAASWGTCSGTRRTSRSRSSSGRGSTKTTPSTTLQTIIPGTTRSPGRTARPR